jgi:hypothetical protein
VVTQSDNMARRTGSAPFKEYLVFFELVMLYAQRFANGGKGAATTAISSHCEITDGHRMIYVWVEQEITDSHAAASRLHPYRSMEDKTKKKKACHDAVFD